jgi:hypothetical protein
VCAVVVGGGCGCGGGVSRYYLDKNDNFACHVTLLVEIVQFLKNVPKSSKTFFGTQKYQNLFLHFDQKMHPLFATQLSLSH